MSTCKNMEKSQASLKHWIVFLIVCFYIVNNEGSDLAENANTELESNVLDLKTTSASAFHPGGHRLLREIKQKNMGSSPSTTSETLFLKATVSNATASSAAVRRFDRIVLIVHENTSYQKFMNDPYFQSLGKRGALFTNFHALLYGNSFPEYLAMAAGSTYGNSPTIDMIITDKCIADLLEAKGMTWRHYLENYPGNCFLGSSNSAGTYVRRHCAFLSFKSIQSNNTRCSKGVVESSQFFSDWKSGKLPNYSVVSPNQNHNGHAGQTSDASAWTKTNIEPLLADATHMAGTLILVTVDEVTTGETGTVIPLIMIGNMVKAGQTINTKYTHYDVLRTVEDNFNVGSLGKNDQTATSMVWA